LGRTYLKLFVAFFKSLYTDPANALGVLWAIALVILGIGFVIFVHELGHFLVAKWAGVKVEMFSLGFGPTLVSWRKGFGMRRGSTVRQYTALIDKAEDDEARAKVMEKYGETEYCVKALPLGGFVKMLGEDPGDATIASRDPRAFHNKPVGSRMAIITAGVVMNVIFGVICATAIHLAGKPETPAVVGYVVAGQPAYEAGLRAGDEIVGIDGRTDITFMDISQATQLSLAGQKIRFDVKRPGVADPIRLEIEPKRMPKASSVAIGVGQGESLDLVGKPPKGLLVSQKEYDTITAAGPVGAKPTPVASITELNVILSRLRAEPLLVVAERGPLDDREKAPKTRVEATIPPRLFVDVGLRMTLGPVAAIRSESPASRAGFKVGDRIVSVDKLADLDPIRLPDVFSERAGKQIAVEVRRGDDPKAAPIRLEVMPDDSPVWTERSISPEPLDIPGLGLAVAVEPKVAAVVPGSPAEKAGIVVGSIVKSIRFSQTEDGEITWPGKPVPLEEQKASWPWVFDALQEVDGPIRLDIEGRPKLVELTPTPVPGWFDPSRGLQFGGLYRVHAPESFTVALRKGSRDSLEIATSIFGLLRSLTAGRQSADNFIGPLGIGPLAFRIARSGDMKTFFGFLGLLSINLAVINFFPIPPLDGGQMVFLIAEKVRGRPLPESAVAYPQLIGIALILILFVLITFKDVLKWF
jgi:regulator of sigma E protease